MANSGRFLLGTLLSAAFAMGASAQSDTTSSTTTKPAPNTTTAATVSAPSTSVPTTFVSANPAPQKDAISKAAAVYGTYQGAVTDYKQSSLKSIEDIDRALEELGGHNAGQLSKGWISYSALVASQNPEFRAALNESVSHYGRDRILLGMQKNYGYARSLKGGETAVNAAISAMDADARRIRTIGRNAKEQARVLQGTTSWAEVKVRNGGKKAEGIFAKTQIGMPISGNVLSAMTDANANNNFAKAGSSGAPSLWDGLSSAASTVRFPAISGTRSYSQKRLSGRQLETANRIATLAAYRSIGATQNAESAVLTAMADQEASSCANMANLHLQMCISTAYTYEELPFCIADHALKDMGDCIGAVAE